MLAEFPDQKVEPWHVIFRGSTDDISAIIASSRSYANNIISLGFAKDYKLISFTKDQGIIFHCIPHNTDKHLFDYYEILLNHSK